MADDTRILALVGDPVAHSLSPRMQNAAIGAAGIDAVYIPLRTKQSAFVSLVTEMLRNGGACNVTSPFKDDAFALPGEHSDLARRTLSVNCVWGSADRPRLDNTDVAGIRQAVRLLLGESEVRSARLFGTGGSARSAAIALQEEWPGITLYVNSRAPSRAIAFAAWAKEAMLTCLPDDATHDAGLGVWARPPAASEEEIAGMPVPGAFLDLNYRAGGTPLVIAHTARRVPSADGREVLLGQGAAAFENFFGLPAPLQVMRAAVEYALDAE